MFPRASSPGFCSLPSACSTACHFCCFWQSCHALHPQVPTPQLVLVSLGCDKSPIKQPSCRMGTAGEALCSSRDSCAQLVGLSPSSPCQLSGGTQLLPDNTSAGRWELALPPPPLSVAQTLGLYSVAPLSHQNQLDLIRQRPQFKVCLTTTLPGQSQHGLEAQPKTRHTKRLCPWEPRLPACNLDALHTRQG